MEGGGGGGGVLSDSSGSHPISTYFVLANFAAVIGGSLCFICALIQTPDSTSQTVVA